MNINSLTCKFHILVGRSCRFAPILGRCSSAAPTSWGGLCAHYEISGLRLAVIALTCLCLALRASGQCTNAPAGLVSWWPAEQNANDYGGGRNHGDPTNCTYGPGKVGYAFVLSGTNSGVGLGNAASLHVTNFSIEGWIQRATTNALTGDHQGNAQILAFGEGGWAFGLSRAPQNEDGSYSNSLFLTKVGESEVDSTLVISNTDWHYVACVMSSNAVTFWLDGTNYSTTYGASFNFGSDACIGAWDGGEDGINNSFLGSIDELSFYTNALGTNDILAIYHAGSGGKCLTNPPAPCDSAPSAMEAWWKGEYSAADWIGRNDGVTNGTGWTNGYVGYAFSDPGYGNGVELTNEEAMQVQNFSILLWLQRSSMGQLTHDSQGNAQALAYGYDGYAFGLSHHPQNSGASPDCLFLTKVGVSEDDSSNAVIADLNWHFTACVKSNGVVTFWLDGTNYPGLLTNGYDPGFTFSTDPAIGFWVGGSSTYNNSFLGNLDEVAFYSRALSSNEVLGIYANGHAGICGVAINVEPFDQTVPYGGNATFSVAATASSPLLLSYQWQSNGLNIAGATSSSYTIAGATNAGTYTVTVTDAYGEAFSSAAALVVPSNQGFGV